MLNNSASKYMKEKLTKLKDEIDNSTILVENFSICLCLSH